MSVRRLGPGDSVSLGELVTGFPGAAEPSAFLASPSRFLYVAEEAGAVVGWLYGYELVRPDGDRMMLLYEVEVDERHRRQGHAVAMVEALLSEASLRGHKKMWVICDQADEAANALYRAAGAGSPETQRLYGWDLGS